MSGQCGAAVPAPLRPPGYDRTSIDRSIGPQTNTVDLRGGQGDVRRGARSSARLPCAPFGGVCPPWRGILAGWHPRVGLRPDPPARGGLRAALDRWRPTGSPTLMPSTSGSPAGLARRPAHRVPSHGDAGARRMTAGASLGGVSAVLLSQPNWSSDRHGNDRAPAPVLGRPTMLLLDDAGGVGWSSNQQVCFSAPLRGGRSDPGAYDYRGAQGRSVSDGHWSCTDEMSRQETVVGRAGADACARRLHRTA